MTSNTASRSDELNRLIMNLDSDFGSINVRIEALDDINVLFGQLVEDMEHSFYRGEERDFIYHNHRKIRVYRELLRYTLDNLSNTYENAEKIKETLLEKIVSKK